MPWPHFTLNDGSSMPSIAYGHIYWVNQETIEPDVIKAIETDFIHLDTAQGYYDEDRFARAIKKSNKSRKDLYITTKWSRADTDIKDACENSLRQLEVDQVDLYLIHNRGLCGNDIEGHWARMELVKKLGYTKSIGVSNFNLHDLKTLIASCSIVPAVNQIQLDPHFYAEQIPLIEYCREKGIVVEAYSALIPLREDPDGPISKTLQRIGKDKNAEPEQVLMAWCLAKGCAVVTSSHQESRMKSYIQAGDVKLSSEDIEAIDKAGKQAAFRANTMKLARATSRRFISALGVFAVCWLLSLMIRVYLL
ncbi:Aldo/keto reductase [Kockovaella imperatae]|uniref:Aldo/keto reductase n=1 Tax=Kockovaella imperatae TaxID=4999 RepID=A0A1Y1UTB3_9TREE|nr:Aldo/keto reductase [Kockovaella imperatae]ORX41260.1 Aldo/keto reductase [Kockovaella imperatae]